MEPDSAHWDRIYKHQDPEQVSWFEAVPERSLDLIATTGLGKNAAVLDVGGGASRLPDALLAHSYTDISVLDVSSAALDVAQARLGQQAGQVSWICQDVTAFIPDRRFDLWHDRALFHFLIDPVDRALYAAVLHESVKPGGWALIATFAPEGPDRCSGLPALRYDGASLKEEIGPDFRLVRQTLATHTTPGGVAQRFAWMLLRKS